jgi:hypothetical protein
MRTLRALQCVALLVVMNPPRAGADEEQKAQDRKNKAEAQKGTDDTKRAVYAADHRIDEAACTASKAECERRAKANRVQEAKGQASDEIHEAADRAKDAKQ